MLKNDFSISISIYYRFCKSESEVRKCGFPDSSVCICTDSPKSRMQGLKSKGHLFWLTVLEISAYGLQHCWPWVQNEADALLAGVHGVRGYLPHGRKEAESNTQKEDTCVGWISPCSDFISYNLCNTATDVQSIPSGRLPQTHSEMCVTHLPELSPPQRAAIQSSLSEMLCAFSTLQG